MRATASARTGRSRRPWVERAPGAADGAGDPDGVAAMRARTTSRSSGVAGHALSAAAERRRASTLRWSVVTTRPPSTARGVPGAGAGPGAVST